MTASVSATAVGAVAQSASSGPPQIAPRDVSEANRSPLRARVTLNASGVPLKDALDELVLNGAPLIYSSDVVRRAGTVSCACRNVTLDSALARLTAGQGIAYRELESGEVVLLRAPPASTAEPAREPPPPVGTITGLVTDASTEAPLASVHVQVVGTSIAQLTDNGGRYTLSNISAGAAELQAQLIGYRTQSRTVQVADGETATADFALEISPTSLNELVVTVTGEQRVREVGNVVARINADSLVQSAPVMSFGDLVQGRAPGVLSLQEAGISGRAGRIRIRGLNSALVSNDPIVVVDGVRIEAGAGANPGSATTPTAGGFTGRLSDLDPDEIQSVEVVKGPSAATLYGTDAANGVLVITTKRGQAGRTRWTAFTEQGLLEQRLNYADNFPAGYYAFGRSTTTNAPHRCMLLQQASGSCVVDSLASFNVFTDPATKPFKDSYRQQYGLQVSGGTAQGATYFLSGGYEQETNPVYMPELDQALIRRTQGRTVPAWQVRPNASERVNLRANFTAPLGTQGSVTFAAGFVSNQARIYGELGAPFPGADGQVGYRDFNDGWIDTGIMIERPAYVFATRGQDVVRRFLGSLATTYSVRQWLTLRGTVGADLSTNAVEALLRRGEHPAPAVFTTGQRVANALSVTRYSLDLGVTATHALSAAVSSKTSVGVQYNRRAQRGTTVTVNNLPLGGETIAGGTIVGSPAEATLTTAVAGGYVEEVLGFRDRLFLTGALRFDGGSAFGQDFAVTAYPKASLSWVVTDGQQGPQLPGVTSLRLRAAYGASGVQPGPTDALARVTVQTGLTTAGTTGPIGFLVPGNPDLKPERSRELEAGLDLEFWQSQVRLELTAYQRTSTDALFNRPFGTDIGGTRIENLGSVRNRGLELLLSADLVRGQTLAAGFTAAGALNDNELRRLGVGVVPRNPTEEAALFGGTHEVDYPVFGLWGYTIESFTDANGNGIIEPTELVLSGPNTSFLGSSFPTREATVAPYVKLFGERLDLSGLLQYRGDFYRVNSGTLLPCQLGSSCRALNDPSTPLADQARAVTWMTSGFAGPAVEDASYLLLRELSLGLTVPGSVARVFGARAGQLVLAGRNLALLWKASPLPIESIGRSRDDNVFVYGSPSPTTYWLLRVQLTY